MRCLTPAFRRLGVDLLQGALADDEHGLGQRREEQHLPRRDRLDPSAGADRVVVDELSAFRMCSTTLVYDYGSCSRPGRSHACGAGAIWSRFGYGSVTTAARARAPRTARFRVSMSYAP